MSSGRRILAYLSGGFGLGVSSLVYFLLPIRADQLGVSLAHIGLLLATRAVAESALSVPLGAFMDRATPRRAYLVGTFGTGLIGLGLIAATSFWHLLALQIGLGVFRPLGWIGAQSYVSGMRSGREQRYDTGKFSFAANLGQIIAPLLAGVAAHSVGFAHAFSTVVVFGFVFFGVGLFLPTQARPAPVSGREGAGTLSSAVGLLRIPAMQSAMLLTFSRLWISTVWISFVPLYLVNSGTSASSAGVVVSAAAIVATLTSFWVARVGKRLEPVVLTSVALGFGCLGLALAPALGGVPFVYLAAAMIGVGQGVSLPMLLAIVASAAPAGDRSLALGVRSTVNQVAAAASPALMAQVIALIGLAAAFPLGAVGAAIPVIAAVIRAR